MTESPQSGEDKERQEPERDQPVPEEADSVAEPSVVRNREMAADDEPAAADGDETGAAESREPDEVTADEGEGLGDFGVGRHETGGDGLVRKRRTGRGSAVPTRAPAAEEGGDGGEDGADGEGKPILEAQPNGNDGADDVVESASGPVAAGAAEEAEANKAADEKPAPDEQKTIAPQAKLYVAARWAELHDPDAPWWTRSQGIGLRLRLRELLDIADARNQNATVERPVTDMRQEALATLLRTQNYLKERHGETARALEHALDVERAESLPPQGITYSVIEAAMRQLDDTDLVAALTDELSRKAQCATTADKLLALDEYIELIDAELAYKRHSVQWRRDLARDIGERIQAGGELQASITEAITTARSGWPEDLRFIIPVTEMRERREDAFSALADAGIVREQLKQWLEEVPEDSDFELTDTGAFDLSVGDAADKYAAIEQLRSGWNNIWPCTACRAGSCWQPRSG